MQERFLEKAQSFFVANCEVPAANTEHYWRRPPRLLENTSPGVFLVIGLTWNDFKIAPGPVNLAARKADFDKLATGAQQSEERAFPGLSDAKTFQYDPDLLLRRMPTTGLATDIPDLFSTDAFDYAVFCLICVPFCHYNEPKIIPYTIKSIRHTGEDAQDVR